MSSHLLCLYLHRGYNNLDPLYTYILTAIVVSVEEMEVRNEKACFSRGISSTYAIVCVQAKNEGETDV